MLLITLTLHSIIPKILTSFLLQRFCEAAALDPVADLHAGVRFYHMPPKLLSIWNVDAMAMLITICAGLSAVWSSCRGCQFSRSVVQGIWFLVLTKCELNSTVESVPTDVNGSLQIKKWSRVCFMFFNICFIVDIVLLCNRVDKYLL